MTIWMCCQIKRAIIAHNDRMSEEWIDSIYKAQYQQNSYICMQNSDILSAISIMNVITEKSCFIYLPCSYLSRNATKLETIQARWAELRTPSCFMSASQKYINSSTPMNLEKLSVHFRWIYVFQIFLFKIENSG